MMFLSTDPNIDASWYTGRGIRPVGRFGRRAEKRNRHLPSVRDRIYSSWWCKHCVRTCSTSTIWFPYQIVFKWIVNCGTCRKKYCHTWNVCFSQIKWTSWNQSSAVLFCKNNVVMKKKISASAPMANCCEEPRTKHKNAKR